MSSYTLYGLSHSLYSGRARSYLIKNGISFHELSTGHESFKAEVLPVSKLPTIPTLVTPRGEVIRDGAAIIEHFESANGRANHPRGPCQLIISGLLDVIGTDGLLRPAMHYRWNFPGDNHDFIRYHFLHSQRDVPQREAKTEYMMDRMRHAAVMFGVTDKTRGTVESLYLEFLDALNVHFEKYPYLLGWRPCIGDFGLIAPMYAHLGRDPYPARLMQQRAPRVYRWVERMNRGDQDAPEYFDSQADLLADDEIPHTLATVLRILAEDFVPETEAAARMINDWLEESQPEVGAQAVGRLAEAPVQAEFLLRGEPVSALAQPYRFFQLQRVQKAYLALPSDDKASVDAVLDRCGMSAILSVTLSRRIGRANNLEVWL